MVEKVNENEIQLKTKIKNDDFLMSNPTDFLILVDNGVVLAS
jgi:hypothetical protein